MPVSVVKSLLIIAVVSVTTFATRAIPFLIFPKGRDTAACKISGRGASSGSNWDAGDLLFKRREFVCGAFCAAGADCRCCCGYFTYLEEK